MRILFIAPYVPSRIRIRSFQIIKGLAERHEVHVLVLGGGEKQEVDGVDEVMSIARTFRVVPHSKLRGYSQSLLALPTKNPMCTAFCWSREMSRAVDTALSENSFDLIHIEHLRAAHFAPRKSSVPVVFDAVDCLTGLFKQMAVRRKNPLARVLMMEEAAKLRRYEPSALRRFDSVIVTSESEREELAALDSRLAVQVIPNGVDTAYFRSMAADRRPKRIIFSGKMSYRPNSQAALWFAENVFPRLARRLPDVEYFIVGSAPPPEVVQLGETPGITVTGYVDDIRPYLDSSSVAVVPMQIAVGIQNKVLEAMAMGLPVVVSSSASRALGANCPGVAVADSVEATCDEVSRLLEDRELAIRLGAAGREVVCERFSWDHSVGGLEAIYRAALDSKRNAGS